jgi:hypothetical protein
MKRFERRGPVRRLCEPRALGAALALEPLVNCDGDAQMYCE